MTLAILRPGTTLPNGALVIITLPHPTDPNVCYVGAHVGGFHPFATWYMTLSDRSTFWGHYSKTASEMMTDIAARSEGN